MSALRVLAGLQDGGIVLGSDGKKIGSVIAVRSNYLVAERGFFTPVDYFVPLHAVAEVDRGSVVLKIPGDTVLANRWDERPADFDDGHAFMKGETRTHH